MYSSVWLLNSIFSFDRLAFEEGFDQFGSLFGQVIIENDDSKNIFEMNLPGVRLSRSSKEKITKLVPKTWSLVAVCKDGFVISMKAREIENQLK